MGEICSKCGLPTELCVCETIAKENQLIEVKIEKRKFGKQYTVITGINTKEIDIDQIGKKLRQKFACGGTVKGGVVELQGNHKTRVRDVLVELGFALETIVVK